MSDLAIKITVVKKEVHQDLYKEIRGQEGVICQVFNVGQTFITDNLFSPPEGFCEWAWADIRTFVHGIAGGMKYAGHDAFIACCTDGFRPVYFKIERILQNSDQ